MTALLAQFVILNNETPDICGPCGGQCCSHMPGIALPVEFGAPNRELMETTLREAFASGKWAIDWWEGDPRESHSDEEELDQAYFVRPATVGASRLFDPSWGGQCIFLGPSGCSRSFQERPYACRALKAEPTLDCRDSNGKDWYALEWLPYNDVILRAAGK